MPVKVVSSVIPQRGLQHALFQDFRGLNRTSDRLNAPPDFLYDLLNGYVKKDVRTNLGIITQRDGSAKFNSVILGSDYGTTKKIRVTFEAKWYGGSTDIIIRAGTAWGKFDGVNTFNAIDTGRSDDVLGQCAMFKNELIMVDGKIPRKMTAAGAVSNLSADANMPQDSDAVWVHRNKVWLNSPANPMIAYFCKTNNANGDTAWTGATDAGTLDLSTVLPVGDRIRAYRTYGGVDSGLIAIICDKYTVIYAAGSNTYEFTFLQYFPTTCLSGNAMAYVGNDLVYPSRDCLTSLIQSYTSNALQVNPLSNYITNLWRTLEGQVSDTTQISGVFNHKLNHYYITFPISGNYQTLVYSADIKNFVGRWTYPFEIYSWCERTSGVILAGSDGYVYTINTGTTDDGTAVSFKAAMPALYFGDAIHYKKPIEFEGLVQVSAGLTFQIDYWYGLAALVTDKQTISISITTTSSLWDVSYWDESYWDTQGNTLVRSPDILGRGKMVFLEFRNSTSGSQITIFWFRLGFVREGVN